MSKERAIRERFGFSAARYHQLLNRAIDRPEAIAYDPMLVRRLRRIRDAGGASGPPDGSGSRCSPRPADGAQVGLRLG